MIVKYFVWKIKFRIIKLYKCPRTLHLKQSRVRSGKTPWTAGIEELITESKTSKCTGSFGETITSSLRLWLKLGITQFSRRNQVLLSSAVDQFQLISFSGITESKTSTCIRSFGEAIVYNQKPPAAACRNQVFLSSEVEQFQVYYFAVDLLVGGFS